MTLRNAIAAVVSCGAIVAVTACREASAIGQHQSTSDVVAAVDDVPIARAELNREASVELKRLQRQVAEVEHRALDRLIDSALLKGEARRHNTSIEQLLDSQSGPRPATGTVAPSSPGNANEDPVIERYRQRKQLLEQLRAERSIRIFLAPFRETIDSTIGVNLGPATAPVHVVEFSDLSCGYSAAMFKNLERLRDELGSTMQWTTIDIYSSAAAPGAKLAARASRCGAAQGRLLEVRRELFEQGALAEAAQNQTALKALTARAGLDAQQFMRCIDADTWEAELKASAQEAKRVGITQTPTVFVNGRRLPRSPTFDAMRGLAQAELGSHVQ